jgi:molecular chaperone DnaK (HSP70)
MKKMLILLAFAALLFGLLSCSSTLPLRFERFVGNVEKKASQYSEKDWEKVSEKFETLLAEYDKAYDNLSRDERERIDKAIGRYHALVLKSGFNQIKDAFNKAMNELESGLGELMKGLGSFLDELTQ